MELKSFGIRFISSNSYFNCDEFELAHQYQIQFNRLYFPKKFCDIRNFTYEGKLPIGAPTSPVISNFVCLELDADLIAFCYEKKNLYFFFEVKKLVFN